MIMPASRPIYISTMTATKMAATRLNETTTTIMAKTAAIASELSSNRPNFACSDYSQRPAHQKRAPELRGLDDRLDVICSPISIGIGGRGQWFVRVPMPA